MITPTHDDVYQPSGLHFTRDIPVMADEYTCTAEIIEPCTAGSILAGDTMNRWCTRGAARGDVLGIGVAGRNG